MACNLIDNLSQDIQLLNSSQKFADKIKSNNNDDVKRAGIERTFDNMFNKEAVKNTDNEQIEINIEVKTEKNADERQIENKDNAQYQLKNTDDENKRKKNESQKVDSTVLINLKKMKSEKGPAKEKNKDVEIFGSLAVTNIKSNANDRNIKNIKINLNDLDLKTREAVKTVLQDLKKGKIDQAEAGLFIINALSSSGNKKAGNIVKKDIAGISVEKMKTGYKEIVNVNPKISVKNDNSYKELKDNKINMEYRGHVKNDDDKKMIKKAGEKIKQAENINDTDVKELKTVIRLDMNELKQLDRNTPGKHPEHSKDILNDNKEKLFEGIVKNTKIILSNNETRFSTMIRPENFGRIDMKFSVKDGKIEGRMILQSQEAADFFKANVEDLKAVFSRSNVEMGKIDIALAGQGFSNQSSGRNADPENFSKTGFMQSVSSAAKTFDDNNVSEYRNGIYDNSMVNIFI